MRRTATPPVRKGEAGNVFNILLAGIAMSGALSVALFQLMGGPVTSTVLLARKTAADSGAQLAARVLIADTANRDGADCDSDGALEPRAWRGTPDATLGAGFIPLESGAPVTDPWGREYGYCVWDTGAWNDPAVDNDCGADANRLKGTPTPTTSSAKAQTVIAVVSSGPDRTFQTACSAYVDEDTDVIAQGGDDIVVRYTYNEASGATSELWSLKEGDPTTATILKNLEVGDGSSGAITAMGVTTKGKIMPGGVTKVGFAADSVCDSGHAGLIRFNPGTGGGEEDPCTGSPSAGDVCSDSTVYAGMSNGEKMYATACDAGRQGLHGNCVGIRGLYEWEQGGDGGDTACDSLTDGISNTTACAGLGAAYEAHAYCENLVENGRDDWYLPAKEELDTLYAARAAIGDFAPAPYWSSTEHSLNNAYGLDFGDNTSDGHATDSEYYVRCVRRGPLPDGDGDARLQFCDGSAWVDIAAVAQGGSGGGESACCIDELNDAEADYDAKDFIYMGTADGGEEGVDFPDIEGQVDDAVGTTAIGVGAAEALTTGTQNTALGYQALGVATTGGMHTAIGSGALGAATTSSGTPITIVNTPATYTASTQATTDTRTFTPAAAGNTLIAVVAIRRSTSGATNVRITEVADDSSGDFVAWTEAGNAPAAVCNNMRGDVGIWYLHNAPAGSPDYDIRVTASANARFTWTVYEVSGLDNAAPEGTANARYTSDTTSVTVAASGAPTQANTLAIAGMLDCTTSASTNTANQTGTLPAGWVETVNVGGGTSVGANASFAHYYQPSSFDTPTQVWALGSANQASAHIAVFKGASAEILTGSNTAVGKDALAGATTGAYNAAVGKEALSTLSTGSYNVAVGYQALLSFAQASDDTANMAAAGYRALATWDDPAAAVAVGYEAMSEAAAAETGWGMALGYRAARTTTDNRAFAIGHNAAASHGDWVAFGAYAAENADTASGGTSLAFGARAAREGDQGYIVAFGSHVCEAGCDYQSNAFGAYAQNANQSASTVSFGAYSAAAMQTDGSTAIGSRALETAASGAGNTAVGAFALADGTPAQYSTAVGYEAMMSTAGLDAVGTAMGYQALRDNTTGEGNTALGYQALMSNTTGSRNSAAGAYALWSNTTGDDNTAIGAHALEDNTGGDHNTAIGFKALQSNSSSDYATPLLERAEPFLTAIRAGAVTHTLSATPSAGNAVVVIVYGVGNGMTGFGISDGDVTDNQGNTYTLVAQSAPASGSSLGTYVFAAYNVSSSGAFAVTVAPSWYFSGMAYWTTVAELSGVADDGFDRSSGASSTAAAGVDVAASDPTQQAQEIALVSSVTQGASHQELGGGWNAAFTVPGALLAWKSLTAIETPSASVTYDANDSGSAVLATFRAASIATDYGERNTAAGYEALRGNVAGDDNAAAGYQALYGNISGSRNTAAGSQAMAGSATGSDNTALGFQSLYSNASGNANTAAGASALAASTSGSYNTAAGAGALGASVRGSGSTAIGRNALAASNVPSGGFTGNTALGENALASDAGGTGNTAIGYGALAQNTGSGSASDGDYASVVTGLNPLFYYKMDETSGTNASDSGQASQDGEYVQTPTLGQAPFDASSLGTSVLFDGSTGEYMRVDDHDAFDGAHMTYTAWFSYLGDFSDEAMVISKDGTGSMTGQFYLGIGTDGSLVGRFQEDGSDYCFSPDTCSGTGIDLTAALGGNMQAGAWYFLALVVDGAGGAKVYINGVEVHAEPDLNALESDRMFIVGAQNAAGDSNLNHFFTGMIDEVAVFGVALTPAQIARLYMAGNMNTALGKGALAANTTGSYNTAAGVDALAQNVTGSYNTAVGHGAGPSATGCGGSPCTNLANTTAIGYGAEVSQSNTIRLGNASVTEIAGAPAAWTVPSDRRLKKDIADSDLALGFLMKLRPVSYLRTNGDPMRHYGFIAQEVEAALEGRVTGMVLREDDPMRTYHLSYTSLVAPLVAAIQQQQRAEEAQQAEMEELQARLARVKAALEERRKEGAR